MSKKTSAIKVVDKEVAPESERPPRQDVLRVSDTELGLMDSFRQIDFDSFTAYLVREICAENTIKSMKRKGWLEEDDENLHLTELGRSVFAVCCDQNWYDDLR